MAQLILGPLLRHLGERDETVWARPTPLAASRSSGRLAQRSARNPGFGLGALAALRSAASPRSSADRASDF